MIFLGIWSTTIDLKNVPFQLIHQRTRQQRTISLELACPYDIIGYACMRHMNGLSRLCLSSLSLSVSLFCQRRAKGHSYCRIYIEYTSSVTGLVVFYFYFTYQIHFNFNGVYVIILRKNVVFLILILFSKTLKFPTEYTFFFPEIYFPPQSNDAYKQEQRGARRSRTTFPVDVNRLLIIIISLGEQCK